jgi:hypothetical protein
MGGPASMAGSRSDKMFHHAGAIKKQNADFIEN